MIDVEGVSGWMDTYWDKKMTETERKWMQAVDDTMMIDDNAQDR